MQLRVKVMMQNIRICIILPVFPKVIRNGKQMDDQTHFMCENGT